MMEAWSLSVSFHGTLHSDGCGVLYMQDPMDKDDHDCFLLAVSRIWGVQNKEAAMRLCHLEGHPNDTNVELKSMVGTQSSISGC